MAWLWFEFASNGPVPQHSSVTVLRDGNSEEEPGGGLMLVRGIRAFLKECIFILERQLPTPWHHLHVVLSLFVFYAAI